jgi:hypothetical protein
MNRTEPAAPIRDLNALFYFSKVVDYGGFSAAQRAIGIPKSRLSRGMAELEKELGVRLLQRNLAETSPSYCRGLRALVPRWMPFTGICDPQPHERIVLTKCRGRGAA